MGRAFRILLILLFASAFSIGFAADEKQSKEDGKDVRGSINKAAKNVDKEARKGVKTTRKRVNKPWKKATEDNRKKTAD